jgi:peptidoglycan/LPS O-acetylase OafA/YrhL
VLLRWYRDTVWHADEPKLDALTSIRFVAAAMIVLVHSQGLLVQLTPAIVGGFGQAVSFFFILSGFIPPTCTRRSNARGRGGSS